MATRITWVLQEFERLNEHEVPVLHRVDAMSKVSSRGHAAERGEVADKVRLIEVAGVEGQPRPAAPTTARATARVRAVPCACRSSPSWGHPTPPSIPSAAPTASQGASRSTPPRARRSATRPRTRANEVVVSRPQDGRPGGVDSTAVAFDAGLGRSHSSAIGARPGGNRASDVAADGPAHRRPVRPGGNDESYDGRLVRREMGQELLQLAGIEVALPRSVHRGETDGHDLVQVADHADGVAGSLFKPWANVRRDLRAACALAGIPTVSPNDLRRTFETWLRKQGVVPSLIAPAMGHADSRMVERVYGRLGAEDLRAQLAAGATVPLLPICTAKSRSSCAPGSITGVSDGSTIGAPHGLGAQGDPEFSREFVRRDGIEPPTRGFSVPCSTD